MTSITPEAVEARPRALSPYNSDGTLNVAYIRAYRAWIDKFSIKWTAQCLVSYFGYDIEKQFRQGDLHPSPWRDMNAIVKFHRSMLNLPPAEADHAWRDVVDVMNPRIKMLSVQGYPNLCIMAADPRPTEESFLAAWRVYCDRWREYASGSGSSRAGVNYVLLNCTAAPRFQAQMTLKPWEIIAAEDKKKREKEEEAALSKQRHKKSAAEGKQSPKKTSLDLRGKRLGRGLF